MKNIYIETTDKPSRLAILGMSNTLQLFDKPITFKTFGRSPQNIYITNSEEIKQLDWLISKEGKRHNNFGWNYGDSKIILTTDQELIKDGVQAIDDDFLEWFVKNPSCDEVEVLFACRGIDGLKGLIGEYKIIIPKEEPKQEIHLEDIFNDEKKQGLKEFIDNHKQETLEEAAERLTYTDMLSWENILLKVSFIAGAKWQQERMYSDEDMEIIEISSIDANYIPHYQTKEGQLLATKFNVKQFKNNEIMKEVNYIEVAERLYKHINPTSRMDCPNSVYITTEKWYHEWQSTETDLDLFDWCVKFKK